jgi:hypothetical protein
MENQKEKSSMKTKIIRRIVVVESRWGKFAFHYEAGKVKALDEAGHEQRSERFAQSLLWLVADELGVGLLQLLDSWKK